MSNSTFQTLKNLDGISQLHKVDFEVTEKSDHFRFDLSDSKPVIK